MKLNLTFKFEPGIVLPPKGRAQMFFDVRDDGTVDEVRVMVTDRKGIVVSNEIWRKNGAVFRRSHAASLLGGRDG